MKAVAIVTGAAALLVSAAAPAQGLLGIGQKSDYRENVPVTVTVSAGGGYDKINYSDPKADNVKSGFIQGGVGVVYSESDHVTKFNTGLDFSTIHYLDDAQGAKSTYYNARASFNITHAFSPRLSITNNFYLAYEIEPDYSIGMTDGRRSGQYLYGYNNFAVSYAWSERFASTTGYTATGIHYQDSSTAELEDRFSHILSQQVAYKLSRTTSLTAEYRFETTHYNKFIPTTQKPSPDYTAHYLLVGIDQAWSPTLSASLRAGAEFYESDRASETAPYIEGALNYALSRKTGIRWYHQLGFDGSDLGDYNSRYSYRTGIIASHRFTEKLTGNAGIHYVHSNFKGNDTVQSATDNEWNATLGVNYKLWKNLSVDANYTFTTISSDVAFRDYDRHYTSIGLNASF